MIDGTVPRCHKHGCQSAQTALCAEGHTPLESCPWFGANAPQQTDDLSTEDAEDIDFVKLSSGLPLAPEGVDELLRSRPVRLIAIVGDRDSGKTTLICSIYEKFLKGELTSWRFRGSRTLVGFEERSHNSRAVSRRATPDTPHTSIAEGLRFFHLCVESSDLVQNSRIDLMLSDRAGEVFVTVRDKPATGRDLIEVVNADRIAILLDGKRVVDPETRGNTMQGVRKLLRALIDGGAVTKMSAVQIVLTKRTLSIERSMRLTCDKRLTRFFQTLSVNFRPKLSSLELLGTAARDPLAETNSGLDDLLNDWLSVRAARVPKAAIAGLRATEFDRLLDRVGLEFLP